MKIHVAFKEECLQWALLPKIHSSGQPGGPHDMLLWKNYIVQLWVALAVKAIQVHSGEATEIL